MAVELAIRLNALSTEALVAETGALEPSAELVQALPYLAFDALWAVIKAQPGLVPPDLTGSEFVSEIVDFQSRLLRTDPSHASQLHADIHTSTMLARLFTDVSTRPTMSQPRGAIQLVDRYDTLSDDSKLADRTRTHPSDLTPQWPSSGRASVAGRASCRSSNARLSRPSPRRPVRSCASIQRSGSISRSLEDRCWRA